MRRSGIHKRSIASSDRQVMSRHARRERDRHRQREKEREEDCIDRLLEQSIDTERQRQQIALMSHTRLCRLHSRDVLGAGGRRGAANFHGAEARKLNTRAQDTDHRRDTHRVSRRQCQDSPVSLSLCCCCGISVGSRQKTSNVASLSGTHKFFLRFSSLSCFCYSSCSSQIYAILSALPKHCSNFFRCLSFAFCFNHPEQGIPGAAPAPATAPAPAPSPVLMN